MSKITSAEFQKGFGRYREAALKSPIVITNHGRDSLVLLAADEYERLKSLERQALLVTELSETDARAMAEADVPAEATAFDHEA
ncbi:MAG TPA: type II toxin-antitoxin system Phd/YefM family antitoxin [Caulobacteraceae bacterium]